MSICSILECYSKAVAKSKISGDLFCVKCAIKITEQHGPRVLVSLSNAKFPWRYPIGGQCPNCGVEYNEYLIAHTGGCPKCHKSLPQYRGTNED